VNEKNKCSRLILEREGFVEENLNPEDHYEEEGQDYGSDRDDFNSPYVELVAYNSNNSNQE
jgi:hypothetical protein